MIPRRILAPLVLAVPVLVAAFAVVMGGYALAAATEAPPNQAGARALYWVAMTCLMLLTGDLLLLVLALGINAIDDGSRHDRNE